MKPLIIANWKMNLTLKEADEKLKSLMGGNFKARLFVAIPTPYLAYFADKYKTINFCAQDVSSVKNFGPYTGEFSSAMLSSAGINYVLTGQSERRELFRESNKIGRKKSQNCLNSNITPVICIGESLENRQNSNYQEFLIEQLNESIPEGSHQIIIAYEPLWAIGTGISPSIEEISEIVSLIRSSPKTSIVAKNAQLVYSGSVNSKNYHKFLEIKGVDGLIVSSSALDDNELKKILN